MLWGIFSKIVWLMIFKKIKNEIKNCLFRVKIVLQREILAGLIKLMLDLCQIYSLTFGQFHIFLCLILKVHKKTIL